MKNIKASPLIPVLLIVTIVLSGCGFSAQPAAAPTEKPKPTATITLTPTKTPKPSATPRPTRTPNLAATQRYEAYAAEAQKYFSLGYIASTDGHFYEYDDFVQEWAQLHWYHWWNLKDKTADFFMSAHFKWSSAYRNADVSGCGFAFAIQDNSDHFAVFLDRKLIRFLNSDQSSHTRRMGVTRGTGRVNFNNPADQPAEADFTVIVRGAYAYVLVDGEDVGEYTLPQSRILKGRLGLTLLSGTNKDYGTRCEMTHVHSWIPNP